MGYTVLVVNPGSTSTKLAVYEGESELYNLTARHDEGALARCGPIYMQLNYRLGLVLETLEEQGFDLSRLDAVMGRGGILPPMHSGGYYVNQRMIDFHISGRLAPHASMLGCMIADAIARPLGIPAMIYDSVSSASLMDVARITGIPEIRRDSFCHALNMRAVARKTAEEEFKRPYEDMRFVVAHLGGGITMSAHAGGRIIDSLADDDGAFAPERTGSVPLLEVIRLCYSGEYTQKEMLRYVRGMGGLKALLGTSDCREIVRRIEDGDVYAELIFRAEALQIAKGIGLLSASLCGDIDAVILTGGMAHAKILTDWVVERIGFIAPVILRPGEAELEALALGALRILRGEETAREFTED